MYCIPKSTNIANDTTGTKAGTKTDDIAGTKAVDTVCANSLPVDGLCGTL